MNARSATFWLWFSSDQQTVNNKEYSCRKTDDSIKMAKGKKAVKEPNIELDLQAEQIKRKEEKDANENV